MSKIVQIMIEKNGELLGLDDNGTMYVYVSQSHKAKRHWEKVIDSSELDKEENV